MTQTICDICRKPIRDNEESSRYVVKKKAYAWNEWSWENLDVHEGCWNNLCLKISKERRGKNE